MSRTALARKLRKVNLKEFDTALVLTVFVFSRLSKEVLQTWRIRMNFKILHPKKKISLMELDKLLKADIKAILHKS